MRYVRRNERGEVVAHFLLEQTDAKETLSDNHPDILAFTERRRAKQVPTADRFAALATRIEQLERLLSMKDKK
jgi:hypothetical protein